MGDEDKAVSRRSDYTDGEDVGTQNLNKMKQDGWDKIKDDIPVYSPGRDLKEDWENGEPMGADALKLGIDLLPLKTGGSIVKGGGGVKEAVKETAKEAASPTGMAKGEVAKAGVDAILGNDDGNTAKMLTPELNGNNNPLSGGEKDTPQTNDDSKSAWEKFVENFIEKPLEWLGWKDKDTPESQPTEPNGQGETDPTGSGNGDNDNPNNPNSNPEPLQVPGAGGGFGAGLGNGNGAGTKDLGDPKTPFYDPLLIALQTGGNNTSISVVSHNEKYNACNDECFFQAA